MRDSISNTFFALADPTRRAILERLTLGEQSVSQLAEPFAISLPAVSKHLRILERAGLVTQSRDGRIRYCHLTVQPLQGAANWLDQYRHFWESQFDQLADYLEQVQGANDDSDDDTA